MTHSIKRREFITLLGGAATVACPLSARAQQSAMPVVGYLYVGSPVPIMIAAFRKGLSEAGYVEGRNVAIEFRFAHNDLDRLQELAADLLRRRVAVIATGGGAAAALAAKAATSHIPIVFNYGGDPVKAGLVPSLNRPGGNVTGSYFMNAELSAKRLGLLHELLPRATRFAVLVNPADGAQMSEGLAKDLQTAASAVGVRLTILNASSNSEIDVAFASLTQVPVDGLLVNSGVLFTNRRVQLLTQAAHHRLPAIYDHRDVAEAGGLMTYGASIQDSIRQTGIYVGRILKGEKPVDLPVMRPTKFEFVINLQTAKVMGVAFPAGLLAIADEVIE